MAEICVQAVLGVADMERKDVNLELIKVLRYLYVSCRSSMSMCSVYQPVFGA